MMALHVGLRRKQRVAAIVGYSGMLTGVAGLAREIESKPPVLLIHGSASSSSLNGISICFSNMTPPIPQHERARTE
ncbi:hypothetical protein [Sphingomonas sp. LT1P40]|uniref:hypothetical protein n=1 Tax=Alteristakelama amylovorans TaxID=3096166 RepID=UPI002FC9721C